MKNILKKLFSLFLVLIGVCSCSVGNVNKNDFITIDENGMYHLSVWNELTVEHETYQRDSLFSNTWDENFITKTVAGTIIDLYKLPTNYYFEVMKEQNKVEYINEVPEFETKTYKESGVSFAEGYNDELNICVFVEYHGHLKDKEFGNVSIFIYENNTLFNKEISYSTEEREQIFDKIKEENWRGKTNKNLWDFKG